LPNPRGNGLARCGVVTSNDDDMYDATLDHSRDRRLLWIARVLALAAVAAVAETADAQLPSLPVLQNAWATPGVVGAVNFGGGSGESVFAGAVGWSPGSGRFQVSGGAGYQTQKDFNGRAVYGARVAIPFGGKSSTFGFGAFAGVGGGPARKFKVGYQVLGQPPITTSVADTAAWTTQIPVGAAIGYRRAIGSNHGISVYATPAWVFYSGGTNSGGLFRAAIGADVGITSSLGATLGVDFGGTRKKELGGPSSSQYGIGVSYAFGRR
jgi:hypothetical protein